MVHELGKQYGWSKSQINEVYPDEATILLKLIGFEKKDKMLQEKIDYYNRCFDGLYLQHGDPEQQRERFKGILEKLQNLQIQIRPAPESSQPDLDDDLPDFDKLQRLREFKQSQSRG